MDESGTCMPSKSSSKSFEHWEKKTTCGIAIWQTLCPTMSWSGLPRDRRGSPFQHYHPTMSWSGFRRDRRGSPFEHYHPSRLHSRACVSSRHHSDTFYYRCGLSFAGTLIRIRLNEELSIDTYLKHSTLIAVTLYKLDLLLEQLVRVICSAPPYGSAFTVALSMIVVEALPPTGRAEARATHQLDDFPQDRE